MNWPAALCAILASPALAEPQLALTAWDCEGDRRVDAVLVTAGEEAVVVLSANGFLFALSQVPAASGTKFVGPSPDGDGTQSFWWDKGDTALFGNIREGAEVPIVHCNAAE